MSNIKNWNETLDPIAGRLRDEKELELVTSSKSMMYHEETKTTALVMDVWIVDPVPGKSETLEEDRWIRFTTEDEIREDFSVDLDDEGWVWHDYITKGSL